MKRKAERCKIGCWVREGTKLLFGAIFGARAKLQQETESGLFLLVHSSRREAGVNPVGTLFSLGPTLQEVIR